MRGTGGVPSTALNQVLSIARIGYVDGVNNTGQHKQFEPFTIVPLWNMRR